MKGEENLNLRSKEERMVDALALKDDEGREKLREVVVMSSEKKK